MVEFVCIARYAAGGNRTAWNAFGHHLLTCSGSPEGKMMGAEAAPLKAAALWAFVPPPKTMAGLPLNGGYDLAKVANARSTPSAPLL